MTINFHNTHFEISASRLSECPPPAAPEVVFAGRSNAGKSTTINTLCKQRQLAFASKTPGRTQLLNFFEVRSQGCAIARLVDLPGYGFAQLAQTQQSHWDKELGNYMAKRDSLVGCVLIVDIRRGLLPLDEGLLNWLEPRALPVHIVLSKADKLSRQEQHQALNTLKNQLAVRHEQGQELSLQLWSALKKTGIDTLEQKLCEWIAPSS